MAGAAGRVGSRSARTGTPTTGWRWHACRGQRCLPAPPPIARSLSHANEEGGVGCKQATHTLPCRPCPHAPRCWDTHLIWLRATHRPLSMYHPTAHLGGGGGGLRRGRWGPHRCAVRRSTNRCISLSIDQSNSWHCSTVAPLSGTPCASSLTSRTPGPCACGRSRSAASRRRCCTRWLAAQRAGGGVAGVRSRWVGWGRQYGATSRAVNMFPGGWTGVKH